VSDRTPSRPNAAAVIGRSVGVTATGVLPAVERATGRQRDRVAPPRNYRPSGRRMYERSITPGTVTPVEGSPIVVPSGAWFVEVSANGDYDGIFVAVAGLGDGTVTFGAWIAARPAGADGIASNKADAGVTAGGAVLTPAALVAGAGSGDVNVTIWLVPG
jgi:hypothetical protein